MKRAIYKLEKYGNIADKRIGKAIRRLLGQDIGLPQGSILGPLLSNCFFHDLDVKMYNLMTLSDKKTTRIKRWITNNDYDRMRNPDEPYLSYYRYADDIKIITVSEEDCRDIFNMLEDWCDTNGLVINKDKSEFYRADTKRGLTFLGLTFKKTSEGYIRIYPKNDKKLKREAKRLLNLMNNNIISPQLVLSTFVGWLTT